jgi:hypothetical protein
MRPLPGKNCADAFFYKFFKYSTVLTLCGFRKVHTILCSLNIVVSWMKMYYLK